MGLKFPRTAAKVFFAVKRAIVESGYHNVTIVGHSLGAALALLDSVYLPIFIPNAYYSLVTYGMPRVGNDIFADYVDRNVNVTRITNKYVFLSKFVVFQLKVWIV
jgi:predicted lipase